MARKIQLQYGGGMSDVVLSLSEGRFYDYEADREVLHQKYGGKPYYTSRSGLSGAGFLRPAAGQDDLVKFGTYRTDAGLGHQNRETVHGIPSGYGQKPIFGYAPIASHGGVQRDHPFVLTDGKCVALVGKRQVVDTLRRWEEIVGEAREFSIRVWWWNGYITEDTLSFRVFNPDHYRGVDVLRFCDLQSYQPSPIAWEALRSDDGGYAPVISMRLGLTQTHDAWSGKKCWLHMGRHGVFDACFETSPLMIEGEVVDGWVGNGAGLLWKRRGLQVSVILETYYATLLELFPDLDLGYAGQPEWIEYEAEFSVLDWFALDEKARMKFFIDALVKKAQEMKKWAEPREDLMTRLRENPDTLVTPADSYAAGNCESGTAAFMKQYNLPAGGVTVGELLANELFDMMFFNEAFRRTLEHTLERASEEAAASEG